MSYNFQELNDDDLLDPFSLSNPSFTQAKFYGDWQKKLKRTVRRFVALRDKDEISTYFQLIKYPLPFGKSYLYTPYGPRIADTSKEFLLELKEKLLAIAKEENAIFVRLDFTPTISNKILSEIFTEAPAYTYHSAYFQPRTEWVLKLEPSIETLLKKMHKNTRYSIRVAETKNVTTEIVTNNFEQYFETFYILMQETATRNKFGLHPKEYYKNIFNSLSTIPNSYLSIARFGETILTINLIIIYGKVANYVFAGTSTKERDRMPASGALWRAICFAKEIGCTDFNFGAVTSEEDTNHSWDGLSLFKKRFGGEELKHSDFFDAVLSPFWYHLYNLRKRIRNNK